MRVLIALFATLAVAMASWGLKELPPGVENSGELIKLCREFRFQVSETLPGGGRHPLLDWLSSRPAMFSALLTKLLDQPEQLSFVCEMFSTKFLEKKDGLKQIQSVMDAMEAAEGVSLYKTEKTIAHALPKKRVRRDDEEESGSSGSQSEGSTTGQQGKGFPFGTGRNPFSFLTRGMNSRLGRFGGFGSRGPARAPYLPWMSSFRPSLFSRFSPMLPRSSSNPFGMGRASPSLKIPNAFVNPTPSSTPATSSPGSGVPDIFTRYRQMQRYRLAAIARELWRRYLMARNFGIYKWPFYNPAANTMGGPAGTMGSPSNPQPATSYQQGMPQTGYMPAGVPQGGYQQGPSQPQQPGMNQPVYTIPSGTDPSGSAQPQVSYQPMTGTPQGTAGTPATGTPGIMAPASGGSAPASTAGTGNPFLTSGANSIPYEDPFNLATNQNLPAFVSVTPMGGPNSGSNMVANDPFLFPVDTPSTKAGGDPFLFDTPQSQQPYGPASADPATDPRSSADLARYTQQYGPSFGPLMYILSQGGTTAGNTGASPTSQPPAQRRKREAVTTQAKLRPKRDSDGLLGDTSDLLQIASLSSNPQATFRQLSLMQRRQAQNQLGMINSLLNPGQTSSSSSFPGSTLGGFPRTSQAMLSSAMTPFSGTGMNLPSTGPLPSRAAYGNWNRMGTGALLGGTRPALGGMYRAPISQTSWNPYNANQGMGMLGGQRPAVGGMLPRRQFGTGMMSPYRGYVAPQYGLSSFQGKK